MATFISLVNFTDQGIRTVKDSPDRFHAVKALGETLGLTVKAVYWTVGTYDLVLIVEGDEEAATSLLLKVGSLGNTRTQTLRGFSETEIRRIIGNMP
ncbi:GYD domain-containing protein [Pseudomonas sp. UBA2684]|uniref:GYD domain-containing protein n=1 Tax=Pseudomonas sp. UBA2684 TaxID=1947311 RepID=UPI000E8F881E|nr:GYD domain-containing protein [Pseudomonas sp. UBA2684]HBX54081.1 GYD family protein [Pseudomonas sp.]|tara:strand:+ start:16267 stop:16557 length:291 start_codon:yes stop_codon:yes gene_type:complete